MKREDYIAAFHNCPECGAGHCPGNVQARWLRRLLSCADCQDQCADDYTLKDEVWLAWADKDERLHLRCFEARLGRPLTPDDFTPASTNRQIMWAWRKPYP